MVYKLEHMKKEDFEKKMYKEIGFYSSNGKDTNENFLVWFLVNYYRLDEDTAIDCSCDHTNDKGIDGIYIDDQSREIIIFQAKFREHFTSKEGDKELRTFMGSCEWIKEENLEHLNTSRASKELKSLIETQKVAEKLGMGYEIKQVFVSSGYFDKNAIDYIDITDQKTEYWDCNQLLKNYTYNGNDDLVYDEIELTSTDKILKKEIDDGYSVYFLILKASDLLKLSGIVDRSLFAKNVRYGLGKTNVNKSIKNTIKDSDLHKKFLLFHNGITIVCNNAKPNKDKKLLLTNYSIVNGCQSSLTLYENKEAITDQLEILVKIIVTGENTALSDKITFFANNQNPINQADLKSGEKFQLDLQKQFQEEFKGDIHYKIKKGSQIDAKEIIENTFAAQLIYSFINEVPYNAHLKTSIFSKYYNKIFTRHTSVYLIYFLKKIYDSIVENIEDISEPIVRSYAPAKFFLLYVIKKIIEESEYKDLIINKTEDFVKEFSETYSEAFSKIIKIIIIYFNHTLDKMKDPDGYIDYKNLLRNQTSVKELQKEIVSHYKTSCILAEENKIENLLKK